MSHLPKFARVLALAATAALLIGALLASSASAASVPAKFSSVEFKLSTTNLTVKRNGLEPKACKSNALTAWSENAQFVAGNRDGYAESFFDCPASFTMVALGEARYDTLTEKYSVKINEWPSWAMQSPWGQYNQTNASTTGTWVNGSGSTPSTLTFTNAPVGLTISGSKTISIDATFKATTLGGGLLTLSH